MKKNKGFTLIELLAVILILGIIALIAIPTVNNILKESRTGAWKSTASQMTKAAENYYQLQIIKNAPYITDFETALASDGSYLKYDETSKVFVAVEGADADAQATAAAATAEAAMLAALSLKGDIPTLSDIKVFTINSNGEVTLAFENANAYCMTITGTSFTSDDYTKATDNNDATVPTTGLVAGGTAVCIAK